MNPTLNLLISLGAVLIVPLYFFYYLKKVRQRSQTLTRHFRASISLLGDLVFKYKNRSFCLSRIGTRSPTYGIGGSYPQLWTVTQNSPSLVLCNTLAKSYVYLGAFPPNHRTVDLGKLSLTIVSDSKKLLEKMEFNLHNQPEFQNLARLALSERWAFLKIKKEIHLGGSLLVQKKTVLRFVGLPDEEIYKTPERLEPYLDFISEVLSLTSNKNN